VLVVIREPRVLQRYTYTLGAIGLVLLACPALLPASISEVNGAKIQIRSARFTIQPEEFAKLALAIFFAGYLVAKRDVLALAGRRVLGIDLPRARDLGPMLIAWAPACCCWSSRATSAPARCSWACSSRCCTSPPQRTSWLLIGFGMFVAARYAASKLSATSASGSHLAAPVRRQATRAQRLPARPGPVRDGQRRLLGKGLGGGQPYSPRWCRATWSSPRSARNSAWPG
jgi:hypothetical protein